MRTRGMLILTLSCLFVFTGGTVSGEPFSITLPCEVVDANCANDSIDIPDDRPIYALLVSGFHQNKQLDMFHFYSFARCLQEKGAYVHYAWWNNLLAPYMARPLHNDDSVPSYFANPLHDYFGFLLPLSYPNKAQPAEDYQFQKDAITMLTEIRANNPDAIIILAGHSMGGDSVIRLARNAGVDIDLLALMDPVGNRTCLPNNEGEGLTVLNNNCWGSYNFTRFQATHEDGYWWPDRIEFGSEVKNLYHRWQEEFLPPYDWKCPSVPLLCPLQPHMKYEPLPDRYLFVRTDEGDSSLQSRFDTDVFSDKDVPQYLSIGGLFDGHGEIVGFRGTYVDVDPDSFLTPESFPLALQVQGDWPMDKCEIYDGINPDPVPNPTAEQCREYHMKQWDADPNYLYKAGFEPWNPGLCNVSRDLCNLLDAIVPDEAENLPPTANAGVDKTVSADEHCMGLVTLDGSASSDPEEEELIYTWTWDGGGDEATGPFPIIELPFGSHEITLVVSDGEFDSDPDTVMVTVIDSTPPTIESVTADPSTLWPANHSMIQVLLSVEAVDYCDADPEIALTAVTSDEPDDAQGGGDGHTTNDMQSVALGTEDYEIFLRAERLGDSDGRTYTIIYTATDNSGNFVSRETIVTVDHDNNEPSGNRRVKKDREEKGP